MSTPDDYRAMAEECFRWARRAQTEDKRQAYLDVARTCGSRVWTGLRPLGSDTNPVAPRSEALKFRCSNELHAYDGRGTRFS